MGMLASIAKLTAQTAGMLLLESYGAKYLAATNPEAHAALTLKLSVMTVNEHATRFTRITSAKAFGREKRAIP